MLAFFCHLLFFNFLLMDGIVRTLEQAEVAFYHREGKMERLLLSRVDGRVFGLAFARRLSTSMETVFASGRASSPVLVDRYEL